MAAETEYVYGKVANRVGFTPKLNAAYVKARKNISNPHMDSVNPHFKSKFASLKSVAESVNDACLKEGIGVHQDLQPADGGTYCYTHLCHESGEEKVFGPCFVSADKSNAHGYGSAATYARRYHLLSVFSLVGDPDDDGNAAAKESKMPEKQARALAKLIDGANIETGEGVDAFGEAWVELGEPVQRSFGPWITTFWPGGVSAAKQRMRDIMAAYRTRLNGDSE